MNDNPQQTEYGFIAQEVQPLFPALVVVGSDPSRTLSLNYVGMIAPLVKALQEMESKREADGIVYNLSIEKLRADNDNLRSELEEFRKEMRELKNGVGFKRTGTR